MRPQCTSLDHHEENVLWQHVLDVAGCLVLPRALCGPAKAMHIIAALSEIGLAFPIQVTDGAFDRWASAMSLSNPCRFRT